MTGIGGDAFALFYNSSEKKVHALNGSGRSAEDATLDDVCHDLGITNRPYGIIPTTSAVAVTVPGGAAAWVDIVERFGSKSLSMAQVLAPAIELAEDGSPISEIASYFVSDSFVSPGRFRLTRRAVDRHRGGAPEKAEWSGAPEKGPGGSRGLQSTPSGRGLSKSALSFHISATG
jgi:gamma-glutamyltranspeptidase